MRVAVAFLAALIVAVVLADTVDDADTNARDGTILASTATDPRARSTSTTRAPTTTTVPPTTVPPTTAPPVPPQPPPVAAGAQCIGDSVMLGASMYAGALIACGTVDATVSRQAFEGPAAVQAHAPYASTVIIHLGTNGTVNPGDLDAMMGALQGVPTVVLVTVQLNGLRSWEDQANGVIVAAADRWPNARLADWKGVSNGHPEYFREDGFHPTLEGAQAYNAAIMSAQ